MDLTTPLASLPQVGFYFAKKLNALGLNTVHDLIHHYPTRYDDFSNVASVIDTPIGEKVTLKGELWSIKNVYTRNGKVLTQALFNDGTSPIELTWFNSPWLTKTLKSGDQLQISGKVSKFRNKLSVVTPQWEKISGFESTPPETEAVHTGRLVPVYPETDGLTSKWLRAKIVTILAQTRSLIADPLPESIKDGMLSLADALDQIHFPENYQQINQARQRLAFDELFFIQLITQKTRQDWQNQPVLQPLKTNQKQVDQLIKKLPFKLTNAQKKVINEIIADLTKDQPMNRLVQGEVGSGKTVVGAIIAYLVKTNNLRTLLMAPTEILAFQHHSTISNLLNPLGVTTGLYTGSKKYTKRADSNTHRLPPTADNFTPDVIIGTHALLSDKLLPDNVGLIIIDEQQRFGVKQRSILRSKATLPHFLTMTATPIPRTVALTLYGDLDLSIIDELPTNRLPIKTHVVPAKKRQDAYGFIAKKVNEGDQVYIITPLIELSETLQSVKAATVEFIRLQKDIFPQLKLGLLHGRLKPKEKDQILNDFKNKKIDILVSTSVVEVGVDISNATIMVIESAERFGLAQLHQMRGRVGRGAKQSYCLLFSTDDNPTITSRLKNLEKISDGLKLAELDMKIRGSGEIFGKRQSGRFELKIADFSDIQLIEKARDAARKLLADDKTLDKYPQIKAELQATGSNVMPD